MKTWDELSDMHVTISRILLREQDKERIFIQSAELDMLAFFRQHHNDEEVRAMKTMLQSSQAINKLTLARIQMCDWFLKGKTIEVKQQ